MKRSFSTPIRVGLLGGGQLARMLALKGHEIGLEIHVLSQNQDDPAAQVVRHHHLGDPNSEADLKSFLEGVDCATFESEFLNASILSKLSREQKVPIVPDPELMGLVQDRLEQKILLKTHKLPTAEFIPVATMQEAEAALERFDGKYVLKQRRFGYDGYGTFVIDSVAALKKIAPVIEGKAHGFIAEEFIPFKRELAFIFARRRSGQTINLPLVETFQESSRCLWVKGPVQNAQAQKFAKKFANFLGRIKYEGVIGVELFETKKGLLINELAPRVHNSGHYSLDALTEDQFTLHLKSILDLPFNKIEKLAPGFAMLNLLGGKKAAAKAEWDLPADLKLHWYGKQENRPGRKMGHLNATGSTAQAALKKLLSARAKFRV